MTEEIIETTKQGNISKRIIQISYLYAIVLTSIVWIANLENPKGFAIITMAMGLFILWGILSAFIMVKLKSFIRNFISRYKLPNFLLVTFGGIILALIEEAIATLMTNMAPLFGFNSSEVFITASANYIEVVSHHSVIVFIPWFIAWGIILQKYSIHPNDVMVLFGITGIFAESLTFGLQNILQFGFWIVIYGLMIYLPAFIVYKPENGKHLRKIYFPLLIIIPFVALVLWAGGFIIVLSLLKL